MAFTMSKQEAVQLYRAKEAQLEKPVRTKYITDYYLLEHTQKREAVAYENRKLIRYEEERVMSGHYWQVSRKYVNGIWGRMYYLYGCSLPKEVKRIAERYDNVGVYDFNNPGGYVTKGKCIFIADVCFDIKKREKSAPKHRKTPVDPASLYLNDPAKQAKNKGKGQA